MVHKVCDAQEEQTTYRTRKDLRDLIRKLKERTWGEMCKAVQNDYLRLPYQILSGKLIERATLSYKFEPGRSSKSPQSFFQDNPGPTGR